MKNRTKKRTNKAQYSTTEGSAKALKSGFSERLKYWFFISIE